MSQCWSRCVEAAGGWKPSGSLHCKANGITIPRVPGYFLNRFTQFLRHVPLATSPKNMYWMYCNQRKIIFKCLFRVMMLLGDGGNDSFTLSDFQPQKSFRPTTTSQLSCGFCTAQKKPPCLDGLLIAKWIISSTSTNGGWTKNIGNTFVQWCDSQLRNREIKHTCTKKD